MTKIGAFLLGIAIAVAAGCSNNVEMPTPYHRDYLAQPTNLEVSQDGAGLRVSWELASIANVAGFVVSFTDANGHVEARFVADPAATRYAETGLDLSPGALYLVQVWAVDVRDFFGPTSAVDSLTVL
jgi:hypothetical protein